ncbi:phosphonate ABC transporter ATP-binding protein [Sediminicurvatus halobius]|uniref:Phosphonate ABC transporter ATP-binding protein n=1 Tax=Sediminicurvatus halobius TaxID=2182432 RepID=A0A2U2N7Q9_9GAMM|nr:phosphonate ABC transporter ATP-binding protein [Spiribacter halobius]PWG65112.1 phosphonate ABC transporter ATP-binding protein [Spiribacter halobius]UEX78938.1 phosphonate ABC transporter ATP-binding protein [Spiribacter halobius]
MLEINDLVKTYPDGQQALRGCSLTVPAAEVVAIIGPSGAGKSTFIRCINRLVTPTGGSIRLDGEELTTHRERRLRETRRQIGMIFQEFNLIERLTVMENVLAGRLGSVGFLQAFLRRFPAQDVERAFELLERVGLGGYENSRADALSGGQRQRVGIARALMQEPRLLLVDEPTSSLDPKVARSIMALICELAGERRIPALINIHDVGLALGFAQRVVGLNAGSVVFDGPPSAVDEAVLTRIYGADDWRDAFRQEGEEDRHLGSREAVS